jgi:prepilin-type N-terminal cleavage/methylation domain-containing protein
VNIFSYLVGRSNHKPVESSGFTLLELMITMIIIGILAAIAYPNFIRQSGKARESEVKFAVGSVNRAQQAYHWERKQFAQGATDDESLILLNLNLPRNYYSDLNIVANSNNATIAPDNVGYDSFQLRPYAGGMFANAGNYSQVICQSSAVGENITPPSTPYDCGTNATIVE